MPRRSRCSARALAIFEKTLGTDHPSTSKVRSHLADLLEEEGRYAEAESFRVGS